MKQKLSIKKATIKKAVRYLLATVFTLWIGKEMILHNSYPEWYWLYIMLTCIMAVCAYGIAEKSYKKDAYWWIFSKYPMTQISAIATSIASICSIIQFLIILLY